MTANRLEDTLQAIHDERRDLPDAPTVSAQVLGISLQDVPQERRWWPGRLSGPSRSLFAGVRLAAAAAVIAVFGAIIMLGALLPVTDEQPATTPTASPTASAEPVPSDLFEAAPVTGRGGFGSDGSNGSRRFEDGVTYYDDAWYTLAWEADDPRLTGQATIRHDSRDHEALGLFISSGAVALETADGRWAGEGGNLTAGDIATTTMLLRGQDAYEGLSAYVVVEENGDAPPTFDAAIFPGEMPEFVPRTDPAPTAATGHDVAGDDLGPAVVSGTASMPTLLSGGSREWDGTRVVGRGQSEEYEFEATDPRLSGTMLSMFDYIYYENLGVYVADGEQVLETADGRWTGDFTFVGGDALRNVATTIFHGEGPYDGLTAYVVADLDAAPTSFTAGIFEGDMPVPPEPS